MPVRKTTPQHNTTQHKKQVFVPTNAAFAAAGIGPDNLDSLDPSILEKLLLYHTLEGGVARAAIAQEDTLYTALEVGLETSGATLIDSQHNPVNIVEADVECSNGYLHFVDAVLMPPDLMTSLESYNEPGGSYEGVFDTFMRAMNVTGLSAEYKGLHGPYTVRESMFSCLVSTFLCNYSLHCVGGFPRATM